jgi:hypothetical protein
MDDRTRASVKMTLADSRWRREFGSSDAATTH